MNTGATADAATNAITDSDLAALLLAREQALLTPEVRGSRLRLEEMLAPEFREFGSSGRVFDRPAIVAALHDEAEAFRAQGEAEVLEFRCTRLGPDAALVTYVIRRGDGAASLRSSVWMLRQGLWVMMFHQGTRIHAE